MLIDQCWLAEHTQHGAPVLEIDLADAQPYRLVEPNPREPRRRHRPDFERDLTPLPSVTRTMAGCS